MEYLEDVVLKARLLVLEQLSKDWIVLLVYQIDYRLLVANVLFAPGTVGWSIAFPGLFVL